MTIPHAATITHPVIVQLWDLVLPQGARYENGRSYHLTEADREAFVQAVADRSILDMHDQQEEPHGAAHSWNVSPDLYAKIKATKNGLRVR